jgi:ribonuclease BN (tRNA processing enzyme)
MRLTTIGTGTGSPHPSRVCAGHLVQAGEVRLLLDCGSGVVHRMATLDIDWFGITHVAITHFHADHIADLPPLIFAWRWGALTPRSAPLTIIGPRGVDALLALFAAVYGSWVRDAGFPLTVREVEPGDRLALGDGTWLEVRKVPHTAQSVAYSVERSGRRVVYTGDTGVDPELGVFARGADVLLSECSLPASMAVDTHLTPEQCGELAATAHPRLLALTHFYPPVEQVDIAALVAQAYAGPVVLATDGWTTDIEDE